MAKTKHLERREGVYYARIAVPKTLRALRLSADPSGRQPREIRASLHTTDRKQAELALHAFLIRWHREFDTEEARLRHHGVRELVKPQAADFAIARSDFFADEVHRDEMERLHRPSEAEVEHMYQGLLATLGKSPPSGPLQLLLAPGVIEYQVAADAAAISAERRTILAEELKNHIAQSNYVLVSDVVDEYGRQHGLALEPNTLEYKTLAQGLMREWLDALEVAAVRDQGLDASELVAKKANSSGNGNQPPAASGAVIDLAAERKKRPKKGQSLRDHFDAYLKEQKAHIKPNTRIDLWATLRQFLECNGDRPAHEYGRADMAAYKKGLQQYPANAAKLYPGVKFKTVIERNRTDGHPVLKSGSVRSKLAALSAFGTWLEANVDGVTASQFRTSLPKRVDRERMEPFDADEVRKILNSLAFVGCESDRNYQRPGSHKMRDWHYWLTLIAAFTGARVNEIVQMAIGDLRQENGIWLFDINDETEGQSLKTKGSRRLLPVHPQLEALGLLGYHKSLVDRGAKSLFHDAPVGNNGRRSEAASRWFRRFLTKVGINSDSRGGMHRWRHTLADALRRADVDKYDISAVLGHQIDVARVTGDYGREMDMSLSKRAEILSRATYPSVDFTLLT